MNTQDAVEIEMKDCIVKCKETKHLRVKFTKNLIEDLVREKIPSIEAKEIISPKTFWGILRIKKNKTMRQIECVLEHNSYLEGMLLKHRKKLTLVGKNIG